MTNKALTDLADLIDKGCYLNADWLPSAHFNERPQGTQIDTIVIHNISLPPGQFAKTNAQGQHHVKAFFCGQLNASDHPYFNHLADVQVSAHVLIERDGKATQFVDFNKRAWHAGRSHYLSRHECNDFSIGIELEGDDHSCFSDAQYLSLIELVCALHVAYPKTRRHLVGHSHIAPRRKTDPGPYFDWQRLRSGIRSCFNGH